MRCTSVGNSSARKPGTDMKQGKVRMIGSAGLLLLSALCHVIPGMRFSGYFCAGLCMLCVLSVFLDHFSKKHSFFKCCKMIFRCGLLGLLVILALLEAYVLNEGHSNRSALPADAVIVLGAGVNGTRPSLALQTRIDAAETYLSANQDLPAVLSGGQGSGEYITEAQAMYDALTAKGIEPERLILEERSTNTAENFRFSGELLRERGIDPETAVIAVVTNDFHLARAGWIAQKQDYHSTVGVPAVLPWWWLNVNYYLREPFAMVKALIF